MNPIIIDLGTMVFGNTLLQYFHALGIFIILLILFKGFLIFLLRRLKKLAENTETDVDDTLISVVESLKPPFYYFLAFYLATFSLHVSNFIDKLFEAVLLVLVVSQVVNVAQILIDYVIGKKIEEDEDSGDTELERRSAFENISKIVKVALWAIGIMLVLSNLGVDITSLIAGLGIGGIAIAFAMQNILSDLFSSFAIYFDKPFKVGDFIAVGLDKGTVEKIGIKTTRLRTPQGEELVVSNQELTSARIQNFKQMERRRGLFIIGVTYETNREELGKITGYIKDIVNSIEGANFDRVHFKEFGDSALMYEVVYHVDTSDYSVFMDIQEKINFAIFDKFAEKGIEMAYPTQTLFVKK